MDTRDKAIEKNVALTVDPVPKMTHKKNITAAKITPANTAITAIPFNGEFR